MPLAIPLVAGPSAMATILLLMARQPDRWPNWLLAIFCAWLASGAILYFATFLGSVLGERGSTTIQRLFDVQFVASPWQGARTACWTCGG